ncbi:hypothetical protein ACRW3U_28315, partial [Escherichia coli]
MGEFFPAQVFKQLSHARAVIERHLAATLDTIHLFGSAIDGGHCCKVSDEAAFCLIQRPYISKTLLTRRISPR